MVITAGNLEAREKMPKRRKPGGSSAEQFVDHALALIAEKGTSRDVNLREISRRVGCAHTNIYNYFASLQDLLWAAFRKGLSLYARAMIEGLDPDLSPQAYFRRLTGNLVDFAINNPGLYRFIGADPLDPEQIPADIVATVTEMKRFFIAVMTALCGARFQPERVENLANVLLAYLDGEVFNLINGRVLPDEDVAGRVIQNAETLFTLLSANENDGIDLAKHTNRTYTFPTMEVSS